MTISWYGHLVETMRVKSHVFWHSSAALATANLAADLRSSGAERLAIEIVDCTDLPLLSNNDLDGDRISSIDCDLLVLVNFEALLNINHGRIWMRQLRPAVMKHLEQGTRLIVASARPQADFPAIDGSSLATDCTQYICPQLTTGEIEHDISSEGADKILENCAGLRGIASDLLAARMTATLSRSQTESIVRAKIEKTMLQCGAEVVAFLEREVLVGGSREFQIDTLNQKIAAVFLGSGLGVTNVRTDTVAILPGVDDEIVHSAIESAESSLTKAPKPWEEIAGALFTFERACRRALIDYSGDRTKLVSTLSAYSEKIRNNFKAEYGVAAPTMENMPNPARWVDLSDLLEIMISISGNARVAGFSHAQWSRAKNDILPLRNKIQHMRLPSAGDRELIDSYNRRLGFVGR